MQNLKSECENLFEEIDVQFKEILCGGQLDPGMKSLTFGVKSVTLQATPGVTLQAEQVHIQDGVKHV